MIDLLAIQKRISSGVPTRALIPALVPLLLIISSSVYLAVISSIENKELLVIAEAAVQLRGDNQRDTDTINHYVYRSHLGPISPTPTDSSPADLPLPNTYPSFSSSHPLRANTNSIPMMDEDDDIISATAINAGDLVHVLWHENNDIFYKRDGADFDPSIINLSNDAGSSFSATIAVSGNNVHVVWSDGTSGNSEILYRRSTDSGATFGPIINLSNNAEVSTNPAIAVSGNDVHVVWNDAPTFGNFDVFYKRSTDGGASFTEPTKNLSNSAENSVFPDITVSGNNVYVVWDEEVSGTRDILYRRSVDGGNTFSDTIKNLSNNPPQSVSPAIAVIGNNVHVVWREGVPGGSDIFYRRSVDGGNTFPNVIKNLSSNAGASFEPAISVSGNNVHVVWDDEITGNRDILYRKISRWRKLHFLM